MLKLIAALFVLTLIVASSPHAQAQVSVRVGAVGIPVAPVAIAVQPVAVQPVAIAVPVQPAVVYRPVRVYQPYLYQGSTVQRKQYKTPLRDLLFGKYRVNHHYSPIVAVPTAPAAAVQQ